MFHKIFKRVFSVAVAILLLVGSFCVSAENSDGTITISSVKALVGDSVILNFDMENNPGIMALTISITYDSKALTYEDYYVGFFSNYTSGSHPEKNILRMVVCESRNIRTNGTMFSVQFKVNDNAEFDFHKVSIDYKAGDFCNWNLDKLMPKIVSGGVDVAYNGNNCSHKKYSEWETAAEPSCVKEGAKQRICEKCGHVDIEKIPAIGHDFDTKWTLDKEATKDSPGRMSRHCSRCEEVADVLTFSLEQSDELKIDNNVGVVITPSKETEQMMNEQHPEGSQLQSKPQSSSDGNQEDQSGDTTSGNDSLNTDESAADDFTDGIISAAGNSSNRNIKRLAKILSAIPNAKNIGIFVLTFISVIIRLFVF